MNNVVGNKFMCCSYSKMLILELLKYQKFVTCLSYLLNSRVNCLLVLHCILNEFRSPMTPLFCSLFFPNLWKSVKMSLGHQWFYKCFACLIVKIAHNLTYMAIFLFTLAETLNPFENINRSSLRLCFECTCIYVSLSSISFCMLSSLLLAAPIRLYMHATVLAASLWLHVVCSH